MKDHFDANNEIIRLCMRSSVLNESGQTEEALAKKASNPSAESAFGTLYRELAQCFTALINGAGLAAALAVGESEERVYKVKPLGQFKNDPNVTDKKFPGNPTRSYRSTEPLEITEVMNDWEKITPEQLKAWRERLSKNTGEIIN